MVGACGWRQIPYAALQGQHLIKSNIYSVSKMRHHHKHIASELWIGRRCGVARIEQRRREKDRERPRRARVENAVARPEDEPSRAQPALHPVRQTTHKAQAREKKHSPHGLDGVGEDDFFVRVAL